MTKEVKFDHVFDAQKAFRVLLNSFSHPGEIFSFENYHLTQPTELYSSNKIKLSDSLDNNIDIDSVNFEYIKVPSIDSLIYFIKHIMQNNDAIYLSLKMGKYDYHAFVIYKVNNKTIDIYDNNILFDNESYTFIVPG